MISLLRKGLTALAICVLAQSDSAWAQEARELNNALKDVLHIWSAPANLDAGDLSGIATLVGGTGVAMLLIDEPVHSWLRRHPNSVPVLLLTPFREGRPLNMLGRSYFLVGSSAALFVAGMVDNDLDLRNAGRGCATAVAATTFSRHLIARLLGRTRPRDDKGALNLRPLAWGDWEMRSFPGGHGANAMACITAINERFDLGAGEPILYGIAAAVGAGRVVDEAHWASDTFFGLGYGHAVGREIALRQRQRDRTANLPIPQITVGYTIRF